MSEFMLSQFKHVKKIKHEGEQELSAKGGMEI